MLAFREAQVTAPGFLRSLSVWCTNDGPGPFEGLCCNRPILLKTCGCIQIEVFWREIVPVERCPVHVSGARPASSGTSSC